MAVGSGSPNLNLSDKRVFKFLRCVFQAAQGKGKGWSEPGKGAAETSQALAAAPSCWEKASFVAVCLGNWVSDAWRGGASGSSCRDHGLRAFGAKKHAAAFRPCLHISTMAV